MTNPTMTIGNYTANGPFDVDQVSNCPGVYIILCGNPNETELNVIDVGESERVLNRLKTHDRKECWQQHCSITLKAVVIRKNVNTQDKRLKIEQELRQAFQPPCGQN